jgi:hypothetical protein
MNSSAITSNFHTPIAASPDATYAALTSLESARWLQRALEALGIDDRVIGSQRIELAPRRTAGYVMFWRLAGGGRAEITWSATVTGDGDNGSLLSIAVCASADDPASHEHLLAAWPLVGRMGGLHARRTLAAVAELASQLEEDDSMIVPPATLLAVG